jgi:hypothetical protein
MRAYNHISKPCLPNLRVVSDTFNFIPCQLSQLNITCAFPHECFSNDGALQIRADIFTHRGFDLLQLQSAAALVGTKQLSHHGRSGLNLKPQLPLPGCDEQPWRCGPYCSETHALEIVLLHGELQ